MGPNRDLAAGVGSRNAPPKHRLPSSTRLAGACYGRFWLIRVSGLRDDMIGSAVSIVHAVSRENCPCPAPVIAHVPSTSVQLCPAAGRTIANAPSVVVQGVVGSTSEESAYSATRSIEAGVQKRVPPRQGPSWRAARPILPKQKLLWSSSQRVLPRQDQFKEMAPRVAQGATHSPEAGTIASPPGD